MLCKISSIICIFALFILTLSCNKTKENSIKKSSKVIAPLSKTMVKTYTSRATEALEFCKKNKMSEDFCILIDMEIHSGKKRFFVWDFKKNEITHRFLVGHGCGDNAWSTSTTKDNPTFSNVEDSHRSSLGKYKIGARAYSEWGVNIKYLMHGLEESNSNALKRFIVFHSWEAVSDEEVFPNGTPEGWGCPTISNASFKVVDPMLQKASKPVLMWIFDDRTDQLK
ncbi:murein L,D-transpeptidase catalytic domain family protein [Kaistella sp. G5-32]|uniref:Murein L,D-transpeptidase catalytic domain family protein n=2 Tax=Kaistella gelatinilytica TaxID=2787636 RepID=A0ABS0FDC1_9FLAO|nr:murein L,D-transpeptidase catalytic domain family protein [Kaistella gelatinilytica]